MDRKKLLLAFTFSFVWICVASSSRLGFSQCANGVCQVPAKVAKAVVEPVAKTVVKANTVVKRVVVRPFWRWRR